MLTEFRVQGATSAAAAIPVARPKRVDERLLGRLVRQQVVVQAEADRYFLDEKRLAEVERSHRRMKAVALIVLILVAVVLSLLIAAPRP